MKKSIKFILIALLAVGMTSCNFDLQWGQVTGNGNVVTEERPVTSDFTAVRGSAGMDVFLTEGNENKIVVEADENLLEIIETEISEGQLKIRATQNIGRSKSQKVHVTYKKLEKISASSGADVIGNSVVKTEYLTLDSSSGADLEVDVVAREVYADVSSGADLKISGRADKLVADASSGSDLKAMDLEVKICKAEASSGADIVVNVKEEMDGKASSGGDIRYYGNPTAVTVKDGASGSVRKM
ncbi:MAG: head GIN domain-containing protein [Bacteroidota bacterium]